MTPALTTRFHAVVFDLMTALLDSWALWKRIAGSDAQGMRWRGEYLRRTYSTGRYRPYEGLVEQAALTVGLGRDRVEALVAAWGTLQPWPEAPGVLRALAQHGIALGAVTNCSTVLGRQAAGLVGATFDAVVTAEEVGFYKPHPAPYEAVLAQLGTDPARTLYVAGSPGDVPGAAGAGMPVFWHNRLGLPTLADAPRPLLMLDTLQPLLDVV